MKTSLLEKTQQVGDKTTQRRNYSEEELEVVQAWLDNEVTITQIMKALNKSTGYTYTFLAIGCRELYRNIRKQQSRAGSTITEAKSRAARENGKLGGRPRKS
jgi:hypothetical protein